MTVGDSFDALVDAVRSTGKHVSTRDDKADGNADATELLRIVLSDTDPGEPNWLDTCGFTEGSLILRFPYPEQKPERPRTEVMS
jgi:hypothetical protein